MKTFCLSVLILIVIPNVSSSDKFCNKYAQNGHKLSYGYRHLHSDKIRANYIFIDHMYWELSYADNANDTLKEVRLEDNYTSDDEHTSNTFGGQYSMAFCIWFDASKHCRTGLFKSNRNTIDWVVIHENMTLMSGGNTTSIEFVPNFKPKLAFHSHSGETLYPMIVFMAKRVVYTCDVRDSDNKTTCMEGWPNHGHIYGDIDPTLEMMAVLNQYSDKDWDNRPNQGSSGAANTYLGHGSIILFNFGQTIKYCYKTLAPGYSQQCKADKLKVLINCEASSDVTPFPSTTTPVPVKASLTWVYVVILIVIVFAVILGLLAFLSRHYERTSNISTLQATSGLAATSEMDGTDHRSAISTDNTKSRQSTTSLPKRKTSPKK